MEKQKKKEKTIWGIDLYPQRGICHTLIRQPEENGGRKKTFYLGKKSDILETQGNKRKETERGEGRNVRRMLLVLCSIKFNKKEKTKERSVSEFLERNSAQ